jgi:lysyl-tRNA synthetase class 2
MENEDAPLQDLDDQVALLRSLLNDYIDSWPTLITALNSFDANGPDSQTIARVQAESHRLSEITRKANSAAASLISSQKAISSSRNASTSTEQLKIEITQKHAQLNPTATLLRLGWFSQKWEGTLTAQGSVVVDELGQLSDELQNWDQLLEALVYELDVPGLSEALRSQQRNRSLHKIIQAGFDAYPHKFDRSHTISQIVEQFSGQTGEELEASKVQVRAAGRIHAINKMGKAAFIRFTDGVEIVQIYIKSNELDERTWSLFKLLDLGDFIGAEGRLFRTRTGELSIHGESLTFLSKALRPPPDKHYGLHDTEIRYRQRYADLIANSHVRRVFEKRSQIIRRIRTFFDERGYMEVETPMLSTLPTGAAARPFKTHHNALDIDLYARIAPELYLKRLIVGGFEKVYEINRNFRNEGIDRSHNPEFTMLEWYEAYSEYEDLIKVTEDLISELVEEVRGKEDAAVFRDGVMKRVWQYGESTIDFARPWKRLTMREAIAHFWEGGEPPRPEELSTKEGVLGCVARSSNQELKAQLSHLQSLDYGYLLGEVFEHVAEAHLTDPTFITEFPIELSPLSKQSESDPAFVDRFELFIAGMEIANGFCEINDPKDQQARFEAQMKLRQGGDDEAMLIDEDYIRALSYGMPPTAGEGIGIDRLVMVLTNSRSIRDVILFPHMRPEKPEGSGQ